MYHFSYICSNCRNVFNEDLSELRAGILVQCPHCDEVYRIVDDNGTVVPNRDKHRAREYWLGPGFGLGEANARWNTQQL